MQIHVSSAFDYPLSTAAMTNSGRLLILPLHASILVMEGVKGWGVNKKNCLFLNKAFFSLERFVMLSSLAQNKTKICSMLFTNKFEIFTDLIFVV